MLPKINEHASYKLTIPSTQNVVHFRPYLVKEEKVLMLAMETKETVQILKAIGDTVKSCINEEINLSELRAFDVEYMFTKIRSKSVGEISKIGIKCESCEAEIEVGINIDNIKVSESKVNDKINLTDNIVLLMKLPSFSDILSNDMLLSEEVPETDKIFSMIKLCAEAVQTEDSNVKISDETDQEFNEFIESLTTTQYNKIITYIQNIPSLTYEDKVSCQACEHENKITLEGMQDFF